MAKITLQIGSVSVERTATDAVATDLATDFAAYHGLDATGTAAERLQRVLNKLVQSMVDCSRAQRETDAAKTAVDAVADKLWE